MKTQRPPGEPLVVTEGVANTSSGLASGPAFVCCPCPAPGLPPRFCF